MNRRFEFPTQHHSCYNVIYDLDVRKLPISDIPGDGKHLVAMSMIKCPQCGEQIQVRDFGKLDGVGHKKKRIRNRKKVKK